MSKPVGADDLFLLNWELYKGSIDLVDVNATRMFYALLMLRTCH